MFRYLLSLCLCKFAPPSVLYCLLSPCHSSVFQLCFRFSFPMLMLFLLTYQGVKIFTIILEGSNSENIVCLTLSFVFFFQTKYPWHNGKNLAENRTYSINLYKSTYNVLWIFKTRLSPLMKSQNGRENSISFLLN